MAPALFSTANTGTTITWRRESENWNLVDFRHQRILGGRPLASNSCLSINLTLPGPPSQETLPPPYPFADSESSRRNRWPRPSGRPKSKVSLLPSLYSQRAQQLLYKGRTRWLAVSDAHVRQGRRESEGSVCLRIAEEEGGASRKLALALAPVVAGSSRTRQKNRLAFTATFFPFVGTSEGYNAQDQSLSIMGLEADGENSALLLR